MIFQIHPKHGKHIAYNESQAERNRKNGWKDVKESDFYATQKVDEQNEPIRKKPGPKPKVAEPV